MNFHAAGSDRCRLPCFFRKEESRRTEIEERHKKEMAEIHALQLQKMKMTPVEAGETEALMTDRNAALDEFHKADAARKAAEKALKKVVKAQRQAEKARGEAEEAADSAEAKEQAAVQRRNTATEEAKILELVAAGLRT
jgi:hypothetical protein